MPNNCAAFNCFTDKNKDSDKHILLHRFPKNENLRKRWIYLCVRKDRINVANARVCSLHFDRDSYKRNMKYGLLCIPVPKRQQRLNDHTFPTLYLPTQNAKHVRNTVG